MRSIFHSFCKAKFFIRQTRAFSDKAEGGDKLTNLLIKAIDAKPTPRPKFSPEEYAKHYEIGRNYVIGSFKVHNETNHDLACKIRLKNHAIKMIPRSTDEELAYLRENALLIEVDDNSLPPVHRSIPLDTPPVEGYDPSAFIAEGDK